MNGSSDTNTKPQSSRWKRLLQNLTLALGVFLICALGAEMALRLAGFGNLEIYEPHPRLYWRLKPNQDCFTKVDRKPVHINSHGTRGPEFTAKKPPGTLRILSLGDSRTFGWGLSQTQTYSEALGRLLQERFGFTNKVEVINAGVNAWSYPQMLVFYRDVAAAWQPDLVILAEANLWTQFSEHNSEAFVRQFMSRVRLKNFLRRFALYHYVVEVKLKDFYERHRTKFIPVDPQQDPLFKEQQQDDPDAVFRTAIASLCSLAISNGAQPVLLFLPTCDDLTTTNKSRVLRVKQEVAATLGIPLVDATTQLVPQSKALYLEADPVHLNATGNQLVAQLLAGQLSAGITNLHFPPEP
ncbi:MAG TPA: SGNH/GDSL hydrolase family protein [Verrucomicrobiae bacterium]|nr:SGNH/GDSL hydrolase family protein [Verrucomicrobiae bacterium]